MKQSKKSSQKKNKYNPNIGFIGHSEVKVSNYLFSNKRLRSAYKHAEPIAKRLLNKEISNHYIESKRLTRFLKNRDLTFSKKTSSGDYKTFTVPCTTTVVPMQKSIFDDVEKAAQKLIISLRAVIQDIYTAKDLESSIFIKSLPEGVREVFIHAVKTSPNYFPQLHHKNMKDYPFFDNVGLDLVLVEDYMNQSDKFPNLIKKKNETELPGLPFRILEINAGSPSGASNNMNVLEGIYSQSPDILDGLGKLMPNDHFQILGETYRSLGKYWTKREDAVQILLPPGGQNGAAPEIHQLAAYSGLIYTDPDQLYQDREGYIRLRTVSKNNPIVSAVYSRINADSALFDLDKKLLMKDPDSGEPLYMRDELIKDENDEGQIILDENEKPIPLQSAYAIPGIIDAIINRKIYMGGLNRILDNKIILATLTHYAPKFFEKKIAKAGLEVSGSKIMPPQTLPPTMKSVEIIENNPDEWVVKAPELAGGQGVYILKTLPPGQKQEVLKMIRKNPTDFAYQQLVRIARIPVAVQRKEEGFKFANLAADIRTWVFFGAGQNALPRMSHNALVRYAPQEKGKMSSIVNTSSGGGYAPFVIIDDVNHKDSVTAKELVKSKVPVVQQTELPLFVAAQMVQIARMLKRADYLLSQDETYAVELFNLCHGMKNQLKEILSFIHPRSIEYVYRVIDIIESRFSKTDLKAHQKYIGDNQLVIVSLLKKINHLKNFKEIQDIIDNLRVINTDKVNLTYSTSDKALDYVLIEELSKLGKDIRSVETKNDFSELIKTITLSTEKELPNALIGTISKKKIKSLLMQFCEKSASRLLKSNATASFSSLFSMDSNVNNLKFETLYLGKRDTDKDIRCASQYEMRNNESLILTQMVSEDLKRARFEWKKITAMSQNMTSSVKDKFIKRKRAEHFGRFPKLKRYQELINSKNISRDDFIELMDVTPYAKFNIQCFAKEQGLELKDVFTTKLQKNRISILSTKQLKKHKLAQREFAGECFAKKRNAHGLYSNSNIYIWLRAELDPFTLLYTAGHELIHYQQIKHSMQAEKRALKGDGISLAKFLNYYGNFLGANQRTIEKEDSEFADPRKPLYGYVDRIKDDLEKPVMRELNQALRTSDLSWEQELNKYGSLLGYMVPNATGTRVKAVQEVLPALENAKNILFAQELGLEINVNPVQAALPIANNAQAKMYEDLIIQAVRSSKPVWEALRIIASHQYHGINFYRADRDEDSLTIVPTIAPIAVGSSYNQTQQ